MPVVVISRCRPHHIYVFIVVALNEWYFLLTYRRMQSVESRKQTNPEYSKGVFACMQTI